MELVGLVFLCPPTLTVPPPLSPLPPIPLLPPPFPPLSPLPAIPLTLFFLVATGSPSNPACFSSELQAFIVTKYDPLLGIVKELNERLQASEGGKKTNKLIKFIPPSSC
eukprot:GHVT01061761.1.p1 GENE.GHVT01061761.1~~GHVT01061761.1.p1  ORF type:complete len:109 (-),score=21.58 GHVT01061761.1:335-661(-)